MLKNACPKLDNEHVLIIDIDQKKIFPIQSNDNRPQNFRINYTANIY